MYKFLETGKNIFLNSVGGIYMKKIYTISTAILLFSLSLLGLISGYYIGIKKVNEEPQILIEDIKEKQNSNIDSTKNNDTKVIDEENYETGLINGDKIGPNTVLEYKIYYTECNHEVIQEQQLEKHMVNMTREAFESYIKGSHPKWEVETFSNKKVVVRIEKNHLCQNHYIIGEKDGKIAVFRIGENGERIVDEVYKDSPISLLKEIDQEKIKNGIITNSKEELDNTLENYIS